MILNTVNYRQNIEQWYLELFLAKLATISEDGYMIPHNLQIALLVPFVLLSKLSCMIYNSHDDFEFQLLKLLIRMEGFVFTELATMEAT